MYSVVILAGGKSRRMGVDKATLLWQGEPLLERIIHGFSGCREILLSGGNVTPPEPVRRIADRYPGCGPLAGVHAALCEMQQELLFVTTCDAPLIDRRTAERLLSHLDDHDAVVPVSEDGYLQPLAGLYRRRVLPIAAQMLENGELRMRSFLGRLDVLAVPCSALPYGELTVSNLNTPESVRALDAIWRTIHD